MPQTTLIWKIATTVGGSALTVAAVWLNATHIAHTEGWGSPLVAAGVVVTLCAAVTPPFTERAAKTGQPAKAVLLWTFFALAVSFSLSASIADRAAMPLARSPPSSRPTKAPNWQTKPMRRQSRLSRMNARKRGTRCRAAEDAVAVARAKLATAMPVQSADPGAERLAAVLGIQPSTAQLYAPLLLPLGLELGGFISLAAGLAPRRREDEIATEPAARPVANMLPAAAKADAVPTAPKRGSAAYYQARLQRDHPALAQRVVAGEISIYKASIKAGLRKAPTRSAKWTKADAYTKLASVAG